MTIESGPPDLAGDENDDSHWREEILALRQLVSVLAMRIAARAENPFEELQTIRRLAQERAAGAALCQEPKRDPDIVMREIDGMIGQAESRII
jgi:hypothetical protein